MRRRRVLEKLAKWRERSKLQIVKFKGVF